MIDANRLNREIASMQFMLKDLMFDEKLNSEIIEWIVRMLKEMQTTVLELELHGYDEGKGTSFLAYTTCRN